MGFETVNGPRTRAVTRRSAQYRDKLDGDKRGRGRPHVLYMRPEIADEIAGYIRQGMFAGEAAALAGITTNTVHRWLQAGRNYLEAGEPERLEAVFYQKVQRAHAEVELESIQAIRAAGQNPAHWSAAAWFLERTRPGRYGRVDRNQLEIQGSLGLVQANLNGHPDDSAPDGTAVLTAIAEILSAGAAEDPGQDGPAGLGGGSI